MISVIIECRNQESALAATLAALVQGAVEGLVAEVIVIDHGSTDGTAKLADAAGCRLVAAGDLHEVIGSARGDWLLLIEPGARPLLGWIEHLHQHIAGGRRAARFSPSREYREPFFARIRRRCSPLEHGVLVPKAQVLADGRTGTSLEVLARGISTQKLKCEIVPAAVLDLA